MVRIGDIWDRTVDVLRGRAGILATIAALTIVLPAVVGTAVRLLVATRDPWLVLVPAVSLASVVLMILGVLAMTAVASDPAVDRAGAFRIAVQRLLPALGIVVALMVIAGVLLTPAVVLMALAGVSVNKAGGVVVPAVGTGLTAAAALAFLATVALGLWVSARIVPLFGIVVNERCGLGALRRSFALSRGATLRLIGVLLLYVVVAFVVALAATSVVGVVAGLTLGRESVVAALIIATVSAIVSALTTVVQSVFYARFYVAAVEREQRMAPLV